METKPTEIASSKMFGGYNKRYKHFSPTLGCSMTFHIYFPPSPSTSHKFPVCALPFSTLFSICFGFSVKVSIVSVNDQVRFLYVILRWWVKWISGGKIWVLFCWSDFLFILLRAAFIFLALSLCFVCRLCSLLFRVKNIKTLKK